MRQLGLLATLGLLLIVGQSLHIRHDAYTFPTQPCLFGYETKTDGRIGCKSPPGLSKCPSGTIPKPGGGCMPIIIRCPPGTIPTSGGGCKPIYILPRDWIEIPRPWPPQEIPDFKVPIDKTTLANTNVGP